MNDTRGAEPIAPMGCRIFVHTANGSPAAYITGRVTSLHIDYEDVTAPHTSMCVEASDGPNMMEMHGSTMIPKDQNRDLAWAALVELLRDMDDDAQHCRPRAPMIIDEVWSDRRNALEDALGLDRGGLNTWPSGTLARPSEERLRELASYGDTLMCPARRCTWERQVDGRNRENDVDVYLQHCHAHTWGEWLAAAHSANE